MVSDMAGTRRSSKRLSNRTFMSYDYMLLLITLAIALFGVIMVYSASYYAASVRDAPFRFVKSQLTGLGIGFILMIGISKIDYQIFTQTIIHTSYNISLTHILYFIACGLQIAVLAIGIDRNGAKRWIAIGGIEFQPSEISKIVTIIFVAYAVYRNRKALDSVFGFAGIIVYPAILAALIAKENLSTAIIIAGVAVAMCFVASKKKWYFLACIAFVVVVAALYVLFGDPFRQERFAIWQNVETHPKGLQIRQGLYAVASGGLFGKGLGRSMQKLGYIPEAYNDMIFAVICEELGIVGVTIIIIVFLLLFWRILFIACHAPDIFGTMLCAGIMIQLALQVMLNIAVVTNTLPSTGVALPFISYGGTSVMILMAEMGFVLGVSRQIKQI